MCRKMMSFEDSERLQQGYVNSAEPPAFQGENPFFVNISKPDESLNLIEVQWVKSEKKYRILREHLDVFDVL